MVRPGGASIDERQSGAGRARDRLGMVLGTWGVLTAGAVWFVVRWGTDLPSWDLWGYTEVAAGFPVSWSWVFAQAGASYYPAAKLLGLVLLAVSGRDYRAFLLFDAAAMSGLALALVLLVRRARGWTDWRDSFLPLLFLHWGHHEALLENFVYIHVVSAAAAGMWLMCAAWDSGPPGSGRAAGWAASTVLLPAAGPSAAVISVPLIAWTAWVAFDLERSASMSDRRRGLLLLAGVAAACLELGWFVARILEGGLGLPFAGTGTGGGATVAWSVARYFSTALGPASGGASWIAAGSAVVMLGAAAATGGCVKKGGPERNRAGATLAAVLGLLATGIAVGLVRGPMAAQAGSANRYSIPSAIAWSAAYLAFALNTRGIFPARRLTTLLWAAVLAAWPLNAAYGTSAAAPQRLVWNRLRQGALDGVPIVVQASRVWPHLFSSEEWLVRYFRILAREQTGPWRNAPPPLPRLRLPPVRRGQELLVLQGHPDRVRGVAWSADGRFVASGDEAGLVVVHDARTGWDVARWKPGSGVVSCLGFAAPNRLLAGGWEFGMVECTIPEGRMIRRVWPGRIVALAVAERGGLIAWSESGSDATARWAARDRAPTSLAYHMADVRALAWDPAGRLLVTGGGEGRIALWDPPAGALLCGRDVHVWAVLAAAWAPDGRAVVTAGWDGRVRVTPVQGGRLGPTGEVDGGHGWIAAVAWSPDGRTIAAAGEDHVVRLYSSGVAGILRALEGHQDSVVGLAFSPDGRLLASAGWDGTVRIWRTPR